MIESSCPCSDVARLEITKGSDLSMHAAKFSSEDAGLRHVSAAFLMTLLSRVVFDVQFGSDVRGSTAIGCAAEM